MVGTIGSTSRRDGGFLATSAADLGVMPTTIGIVKDLLGAGFDGN